MDIEAFTPQIDSSDIGPQIWEQVARMVVSHYDEYDGFVVLHGTDTMSYSASALSFMLENLSKPVVFTGSQLPVGVLRSDAKENLLTAIEIAAAKDEDGNAIVPEVTIFLRTVSSVQIVLQNEMQSIFRRSTVITIRRLRKPVCISRINRIWCIIAICRNRFVCIQSSIPMWLC